MMEFSGFSTALAGTPLKNKAPHLKISSVEKWNSVLDLTRRNKLPIDIKTPVQQN